MQPIRTTFKFFQVTFHMLCLKHGSTIIHPLLRAAVPKSKCSTSGRRPANQTLPGTNYSPIQWSYLFPQYASCISRTLLLTLFANSHFSCIVMYQMCWNSILGCCVPLDA